MSNMWITAGSVDISPITPVPLAGVSAHIDRLWTARASPLEANAVAFRSGGRTVVLVSVDTLFVGPELPEFVQADIRARRQSDSAAEIILVATHTHFAPMLDRTKPRLGTVDPAYFDMVRHRISDLVSRVLQSAGQAAGWRRAQARVAGAVNRRLRIRRPVLQFRQIKFNTIAMAPNPGAPAADMARMTLLMPANAKSQDAPIAILAGWSCHPTSFPGPSIVCAEYIGRIRDALRRRYPAVPVVFLQGFCGDVRASLQGPRTLAGMLRTVISGPHFRTPTMPQWEAWAGTLAAQISAVADAAAATPSQPFAAATLSSRMVGVPLDRIVDQPQPGRTLEARLVDLAGPGQLFMISAEPSAALAQYVRAGDTEIWPVGYLADVFGYLATDAQVAEGGYKADRFRYSCGIDGRMKGTNEAVLRDLMAQITQPGPAPAGQGVMPVSESRETGMAGSANREIQVPVPAVVPTS